PEAPLDRAAVSSGVHCDHAHPVAPLAQLPGAHDHAVALGAGRAQAALVAEKRAAPQSRALAHAHSRTEALAHAAARRDARDADAGGLAVGADRAGAVVDVRPERAEPGAAGVTQVTHAEDVLDAAQQGVVVVGR